MKKEVVATETKKVTFDTAAFAASIQKSFASDKNVDVAIDSSLDNPRDTSCPENSYIHFFRKGTTKDLFKMYNMPKRTRFAISKACEVEATEDMQISPVMNTKTKTIKWINVYTGHDSAVEVAKILIQASLAVPEKKSAKKAEKPAEDKKAPEKKAPAAKKATKKTKTA